LNACLEIEGKNNHRWRKLVACPVEVPQDMFDEMRDQFDELVRGRARGKAIAMGIDNGITIRDDKTLEMDFRFVMARMRGYEDQYLWIKEVLQEAPTERSFEDQHPWIEEIVQEAPADVVV
jgi:hypothetical protein